MFWRVASFNQSSAVEAVLDRPDYTLEDLLEEDDLIQVRLMSPSQAVVVVMVISRYRGFIELH